VRYIVMSLVMFGVWLLWSGHYSFDHSLVLGLGIGSCLFVVYMASRMLCVDEEGHPVHLTFSLLLYIPWLVWAIVKSNIDVAKRILSPNLPISPRMVRIKATQKTDLTRVIFANSITLTPGTVSVDLVEDDILIHALTKEAAEDVQSGDMDQRVTRLET